MSTYSTTATYLLDSATDLGREQLECLEVLLDAHTSDALDAIALRPGQTCLEIGAGSGSIARLMADRVRPTGRVTAIDIETSRLASGRGIEVSRHDLNDGVPAGGPFDLIHARLVLMHLPRRREIVAELIDALAPGGWLVIGEYFEPTFEPISAPSRDHADLYARVLRTTIDKVGRPGGISYEWAHEMDDYLDRAGLLNIHSDRHTSTAIGGETECVLIRNYVLQAAPLLVQAGIDQDELDRFTEMMLDPRFRTWFFEYTCVRAQKPIR